MQPVFTSPSTPRSANINNLRKQQSERERGRRRRRRKMRERRDKMSYYMSRSRGSMKDDTPVRLRCQTRKSLISQQLLGSHFQGSLKITFCLAQGED
jgi:hypothetical protein